MLSVKYYFNRKILVINKSISGVYTFEGEGSAAPYLGNCLSNQCKKCFYIPNKETYENVVVIRETACKNLVVFCTPQ